MKEGEGMVRNIAPPTEGGNKELSRRCGSHVSGRMNILARGGNDFGEMRLIFIVLERIMNLD